MTAADARVGNTWTVTITQQALDTITAEVHLGGTRLETGGILLGHEDSGACTTAIAIAGGPGPGAVRQPRHFSRDSKHAQQLASRAWESHRAQWIGEWHTHIHGPPVPSATDLTTYITHMRDPELNFVRFVSLIVTVNTDHPAALVAWLVDTQEARQVPLQLIQEATQ